MRESSRSSDLENVEAIPHQTGFLTVGSGHSLFWEQWGQDTLAPVLFLHGGPGCGFDASYLPLFDFSRCRLVTFDQRGCGRSAPLGSLESNTTDLIIDDIEAVRQHLGIDDWSVTGHSWGTALAILYAKQHRRSVRSMALSGLFGGRRKDHLYCFETAPKFYPTAYAKLLADVGALEGQVEELDLWLEQSMTNGSLSTKKTIARALSNYFRQIAFLEPLPQKGGIVLETEVAQWDIFLSFAKANFFLNPNNGIFEDISKLTDLPISLVHGRFDRDCSVEQALLLKALLPSLKLVLTDGNHDVGEILMRDAYKKEIDQLYP